MTESDRTFTLEEKDLKATWIVLFVFTNDKYCAQAKAYLKSISGQKYHVLKNAVFATLYLLCAEEYKSCHIC